MTMKLYDSNFESSLTFTPAEAAKILGLTVHTLAVWRCTGRYNLPYIKVGRKIRYRLLDIQLWMRERTHSHTSEKTEVQNG